MSGDTQVKKGRGALDASSEQLSEWGSKGGRPVKHTEASLCLLANELLIWLDNDDNIFFEEFLLKYGVHTNILNQYIDKFPAFADLVKEAKKKQELKLAKGSITGKYRDAGSIFLLKAYHGLREKDDAPQGLNAAPIVINFLKPGSSSGQPVIDTSFSIVPVPPKEIEPQAPDSNDQSEDN
jgi:hypothetical protein